MISASSPVRFGSFELDLQSGELRKDGLKIRLADQPLQVLRLLLAHPGEVVTREELQRNLWSSDTFVEFEHSLNAAVKRLREALGDSAEKPRYVETLPRHGYRFIAPLLSIDKSRAQTVARERSEPAPAQKWRRWAVAVALLVVATVSYPVGRWIWQRWHHSSDMPIRVIAVLPLENLSNDPSQEYFSDGITEALITELGQMRSLRVISHQSVTHFKGTTKTIPQIATELNVDALVEGSVLRDGDKVRISVQLVRAKPEEHVWAQSYERDLRDVIALQREVSHAIVSEIQGTLLTSEEKARLARARPVNPEAYQAYLKGRHYWSQRNFENLHKGMEQFRQAIALDPGYAPAYAGLADSYLILSSFGLAPANEGVRQARAAAQQALTLDENLAEAHTSLADILAFSDWNWAGAEKEFRRALELNPNYATGHQWYAEMLMAVGRSQESLAEVRKAQDVDPLSPAVNAIAGWLLSIDRQYDAAIRQEHKVLEMYPDLPFGHFMLGVACWGGGRRAEAVAALEKAYQLEKDRALSLAFLTYAYAQSGRRTEALQLRQELKRREKVGYVDPHALALVSLGFEEKEQALTLLEKVFERGGFSDEQLRQPFYDPIRSDPRFQNLLRRMNLPQ